MPRRYGPDGTALWNGKAPEDFSEADVYRFMAETEEVLQKRELLGGESDARSIAQRLAEGRTQAARDDAARDLCRAFASGQLLPVSQYLVGLENKRLKREQLQQLLENAWRASAEALLAACGKPDPADIPGAEELRRGLTVRQLQGMTDLMKQYCLECRYNVGVGHVLGALCAGWEKLL